MNDPDARGPVERLDEIDGRAMPRPAPELGPGLAADMVGGHHRLSLSLAEQPGGDFVVGVSAIAQGYPEGGVVEDHP